ncbi:restriction endonuclease subunit S [Algibacter sp. 2305UL17-15]|uniref:restriction endonuclease subunit S n=1 Tax=Algibacter sp. 2305UL17-15 TaxID=3231268 RepID=UPI0034576B82
MELKKGYKRTDIGVIPEDWDLITYDDAFLFLSTATYSRAQLSKIEPIKYIHYGDIHTRFKHFLDLKSELPTVSEIQGKRYSLIKDGDIIMADASEDYEGVGKSVEVINSNSLKAISGLHTFLFRDKNGHFANGFKAYISENILVKNSFKRLTTGMKVFGVSKTNLKTILIPKPPLNEQKSIAEVLIDTVLLIKNLNTVISKKKAIKQGAMQELLTGKKRLKGFEEKWKLKRLGEVLSFQVGYPFLSVFFNEKEGVRLIKNRDLKNDGKIVLYSDSDFPSEYIVKNGDVLIGMDGDFIPCLWNKGIGLLNQRIGRLVSNKVNLTFFYYFLIKPLKDIEEITSSTTVKHLSHSDIEELVLPIPNFKEQEAIAQILSDMDSEIEALETQLQKTENLKQGMIQELLTGKIRLVKPIIQPSKKDLVTKLKVNIEDKIIPIVTNPEKDSKSEKPRNEHITDAVLIGTMAEVFGSDKFPLTRFMYTKVSYLVKRYKEEEDKGYLKKAAGPYKPKTRYGGAEKIALENKYVKKHISNHNGKKYENFIAGANSSKAVEYFKKWYGENALQWIQQFKFTKRNQLELWATVDMAMQDLLLANKLVNFQTVKQLINDDKEWRPKLKRPIFSDDNLKSAIHKLNQLFS